jgi:hypothetical protein
MGVVSGLCDGDREREREREVARWGDGIRACVFETASRGAKDRLRWRQ